MNKRPEYRTVGAIFVLILAVFQAAPAAAFSKGLTSKVRAMQQQAYVERLKNARQAYDAGDFQKSIQEAWSALQHAKNDEMASPARILLAASYKKLGDPASAKPHVDWLRARQK